MSRGEGKGYLRGEKSKMCLEKGYKRNGKSEALERHTYRGSYFWFRDMKSDIFVRYCFMVRK